MREQTLEACSLSELPETQATPQSAQRAFAVDFGELRKWIVPRRLVLSNDLPDGWKWVSIEDLVSQVSFPVTLEQDKEYDLLGVKWYGQGVFHRETLAGRDIEAKTLFRAVPGAFIYNRLFAWKESFAVVAEEHSNALVSGEFPQFLVDAKRLSVEYLRLFFLTPDVIALVNGASAGSAAVSRNRFKESEFLRFEIPLPVIEVQCAIVERAHRAKADYENGLRALETKRAKLDQEFLRALGLVLPPGVPRRRVMAVGFHQMPRWDLESAQRIGRERLLSHFEEKPLGEVVYPLAETNTRQIPASKPDAQWNYIGMENVEARSGRLVNFAPSLGAEIISASVVFDGQSLLYGKLRPYLRKVIVPADFGLTQGVASSEFLVFKPRPELDLHFLGEFLRSTIVADYTSQSIGGRMPRVSPATLLEIPIPTPPLETQRAIVARLRDGQQEIESTRRSLETDFKAAQIEVENRILGRTPSVSDG